MLYCRLIQECILVLCLVAHAAAQCTPTTCTKSADCSVVAGKIACNCKTGFTKKSGIGTKLICAKAKAVCTPTACTKFADCSVVTGKITCNCKKGFTKKSGSGTKLLCETAKAVCTPTACTKFADCRVVTGKITCNCKKGFTKKSGSGATLICKTAKATCTATTCTKFADCSVATGKVTCTCKKGFTKKSGSGTKLTCKKAVVCTPTSCSKLADCKVSKGKITCSCKTGYTKDFGKGVALRCKDIDECTSKTTPHNCPKSAKCVNVDSSFRCDCPTGFIFKKTNCENINECLAGPFPCRAGPKLAVCVDIKGSFTCSCKPGYVGDGMQCVDIDECASQATLCNQECKNTAGSFVCICDKGYQLRKGVCNDIDECALGGANTCSQFADCTNTKGAYLCKCRVGFAGDGKTCADIDECAHNINIYCKDLASKCENTLGSFQCKCLKGFTGNGQSCIDTNECSSDRLNSCSNPNMMCTNTQGSYTCSCESGFIKVVNKCIDVDECSSLTGGHDCVQFCVNTPGSYSCGCRSGYQGLQCTDIDECSNPTLNSCPHGCENTPGSFTCVCHSGYSGNGKVCKDIDECQQAKCTQACVNSPGGFRCTCNTGFVGDGITCADFNECQHPSYHDCYPPAKVCENLPGSYRCKCAPGFSSSGITCAATPKTVGASFRLLDYTWSPKLGSSLTPEYQDFTQYIENNLRVALQRMIGFQSASVVGFRPGSVIVDTNILVTSTTSTLDAQTFISSLVRSGTISQLRVDPNNYPFLGHQTLMHDDPSSVEVVAVSPSSELLAHDTSATFTCSVRTENILAIPAITWQLNGVPIRPLEASRITTTVAVAGNATDMYASQLFFNNILDLDSGELTCHTFADSLQHEWSVNISIASPRCVELTPYSATVRRGLHPTLDCVIIDPSRHLPHMLVWYKNGNVDTSSQGENMLLGSSKATLVINGLDAAANYSCGLPDPACQPSRTVTVTPVREISKACRAQTDSYGIKWSEMDVGLMDVKSCPGSSIGVARRVCSPSEGGSGQWLPPDYVGCVTQEVSQVEQKLQTIADGLYVDSLQNILQGLYEANADHLDELPIGDIQRTIAILAFLTRELHPLLDAADSDEIAKSVLQVIGNLLTAPKRTWDRLQEQSSSVIDDLMKMLTDFSQSSASDLQLGAEKEVKASRIDMKLMKTLPRDVKFPNTANPDATSVTIDQETLKRTFGGTAVLPISVSIVKDLPKLLSSTYKTEQGVLDADMIVVSDVISVDVSRSEGIHLAPPIHLKFHHNALNASDTVCVYYEYNLDNSSGGGWSGQGCRKVLEMHTWTECECSHLSYFTVLADPARQKQPIMDSDHPHFIEIKGILAVGIALSILGTFLTICISGFFWNHISFGKNFDGAALMMNICIALTVAYSLLLPAIYKTEHALTCIILSCLLHYFFMAVFFLLMAQGFNISANVACVTTVNSKLAWLIPVGWVSPAIIVGITMAVTELSGFGNEKYCWFDIGDSLMYSFVGPSAAAWMMTMFIVGMVVWAVATRKTDYDQEARRALTFNLGSLGTLLFVVPLTWALAIISLNQEEFVYQYLFATCSAFQGIFIFVYHCIYNRLIRDSMKDTGKRYRLSNMSINTPNPKNMGSVNLQNDNDNNNNGHESTAVKRTRSHSTPHTPGMSDRQRKPEQDDWQPAHTGDFERTTDIRETLQRCPSTDNVNFSKQSPFGGIRSTSDRSNFWLY